MDTELPDTDAPVEATPAEAQETEAHGHYIKVPLCGEIVEMVPGGAWRQSAMRNLRDGAFDEFFEEVMSPDSYERYLDLNPTNDEVGRLLDDAGAASGESEGKSGGRRPSSRRTRRR